MIVSYYFTDRSSVKLIFLNTQYFMSTSHVFVFFLPSLPLAVFNSVTKSGAEEEEEEEENPPWEIYENSKPIYKPTTAAVYTTNK